MKQFGTTGGHCGVQLVYDIQSTKVRGAKETRNFVVLTLKFEYNKLDMWFNVYNNLDTYVVITLP